MYDSLSARILLPKKDSDLVPNQDKTPKVLTWNPQEEQAFKIQRCLIS